MYPNYNQKLTTPCGLNRLALLVFGYSWGFSMFGMP